MGDSAPSHRGSHLGPTIRQVRDYFSTQCPDSVITASQRTHDTPDSSICPALISPQRNWLGSQGSQGKPGQAPPNHIFEGSLPAFSQLSLLRGHHYGLRCAWEATTTRRCFYLLSLPPAYVRPGTADKRTGHRFAISQPLTRMTLWLSGAFRVI